MPDNVSLTASDINSLKNTQTNAITRLNVNNFVFNAGGTKQQDNMMPLIGDLTTGIKIYAGYQDIDSFKTGKKNQVTFDYSALSFGSKPVVVATVTSKTADISNNKFYVNVTYPSGAENSKAVVNVFTSDTNITDVTVNCIVIGYA